MYNWRIDLSKTEPYWRGIQSHTNYIHLTSSHLTSLGWYEGMSQVFLSCPVAKLLILAGVLYLEQLAKIIISNDHHRSRSA